jgi:dextranase
MRILSLDRYKLVGAAAFCCMLQGIFSAAQAAPLIDCVYTSEARHYPDSEVIVRVDLNNTSGAAWEGTLRLEIWSGAARVHVDRQETSLGVNEMRQASFTWHTPPLDFRGYWLRVDADGQDFATGAIDVSSDWTRFPRYGYLTEFYAGQSTAESQDALATLAEDFHIVGLQYYDWMWRHEKVIQRVRGAVVDPWTDWRGESISLSVLQDLIAAGHARNVAAMPYFMIYGARENYESLHGVSEQWGVYSDPNHENQHAHDLDSGSGIWLNVLDPSIPAWQSYLLDEVADALEVLDFDGVHFDQLGERSPLFSYDGAPLDWSSGWIFDDMLSAARPSLDALADVLLPAFGKYATTFNTLGGDPGAWGSTDVIQGGQCDFLYTEVWNNERYSDLDDYLRWARQESGGQAHVLAAYMNYYDQLAHFNAPSVRLANAAMAVSGAHHIELGDNLYMLAHEFFPNRSKTMTPDLREAMENHYDYVTAFEQYLFDPMLQAGDSGQQWLTVQGTTWSRSPQANKLWVTSKQLDQYVVLQFVNLVGNDEFWRNPANLPTALSNIDLTYRIGPGVEIQGVRLASPDDPNAVLATLPFQICQDSIGSYVSFTIPTIKYWSTVLIRRQVDLPDNQRYEAEDAIKTNLAVDTDHTGYSGSGFVDQFEGDNDGISLQINIPADGWYDLTLRYANATGATATRRIVLDGVSIGFAQMPPLANWDTWSDSVFPVYLNAGVHDLVIGFGGLRGINLDYVEIPVATQGLLAAYYNSPYLTDLRSVQVDPAVDFDWGTDAPLLSMEPNDYLVRWSGQVVPSLSGTYTFSTLSADCVRLFVDGQLLIDHWMPHAAVQDDGQISLTAGEAADLVLVYREINSPAQIQLAWTPPGQAATVIPATSLLPAESAQDQHPPTVPKQLQISDLDTDAVTFSWLASVDDLALGGYAILLDDAVIDYTSSNQFRVTGLIPGGNHTIEVEAFDVFGNHSATSATLPITLPVRLFGDGDFDGDVDSLDAGLLVDQCWGGPGGGFATPTPDCLIAYDSDGDGDIDLADHATFLNVYPHD